jgi:hypothetical protein
MRRVTKCRVIGPSPVLAFGDRPSKAGSLDRSRSGRSWTRGGVGDEKGLRNDRAAGAAPRGTCVGPQNRRRADKGNAQGRHGTDGGRPARPPAQAKGERRAHEGDNASGPRRMQYGRR